MSIDLHPLSFPSCIKGAMLLLLTVHSKLLDRVLEVCEPSKSR